MHKEKPKDYSFADRAAKYDSGFEGKLSRKFYNLLLREIKLFPGAAVLDVGCGTGELLKRLSIGHEIKGNGIDAEEKMLAEAKRKCPQMDFQIARCDKIPFDDRTFDAAISCLSYHHFDNREGFAKEAGRILKPDGVLYIADVFFPWLIRKAANGIFSLAGLVANFYNPGEIAECFSAAGFVKTGIVIDGYAQLIVLKKT